MLGPHGATHFPFERTILAWRRVPEIASVPPQPETTRPVNRSPRLACLSGAIITLFALFRVCVYTLGLYNHPSRGDTLFEDLFPLPWVNAVYLVLTPADFIAGYAIIAWAARLVIMYDPAKRKRWGRQMKEAVIFRALLWLYAAMQGGAWLAVPFHGQQK